jgi:hypothetical protein
MFYSKTTEEMQNRDKQKADACAENGITLVEIPYWWDRTARSLAATIYQKAPQIFKEEPYGTPIPEVEPPPRVSLKKDDALIDKEVRKMFMTATVWDESSMDPEGWWALPVMGY